MQSQLLAVVEPFCLVCHDDLVVCQQALVLKPMDRSTQITEDEQALIRHRAEAGAAAK